MLSGVAASCLKDLEKLCGEIKRSCWSFAVDCIRIFIMGWVVRVCNVEFCSC